MLKGIITGLPLTFPGITWGKLLITLTASCSSSGCGPLALAWTTFPSLSILNIM